MSIFCRCANANNRWQQPETRTITALICLIHIHGDCRTQASHNEQISPEAGKTDGNIRPQRAQNDEKKKELKDNRNEQKFAEKEKYYGQKV